MPTIVDQAVVLRHWEYSETSQTVSLLCRTHGIVRGLAKGSRRERGRFSGGFEVLTRGEVVAITKPTSDLATLTEWDLQQIYQSVRQNLASHRAGLYLVDVTRHAIVDHDPHPAVFDALAASLGALERGAGPPEVLVRFQWILLGEIGLRPTVRTPDGIKAATGPHGTWLFRPHAGGLVSEDRQGRDGASGPLWLVRAQTLDLLRHLIEDPAAPLGPPHADPSTVDRASRLLAEYLRVVLDRDLPTRRALYGEPTPAQADSATPEGSDSPHSGRIGNPA